jgi:XTP/dITP diphosphohydrolase
VNVKLLIASSNAGKVREYAQIFADLSLEIVGLRDIGLEAMQVDEPYSTFEENAVHKAQVYAHAAQVYTLADDSGLEVDALDGRPGVFTARYAGDGKTDRDRYMKLLREMEHMPDAQRGARFVCVIAVSAHDGTTWTARGEVRGQIAHQPGDGAHGFGFDPVFIPDGFTTTFNALPPDIKHSISHRGRAALRIRENVLELLVRGELP